MSFDKLVENTVVEFSIADQRYFSNLPDEIKKVYFLTGYPTKSFYINAGLVNETLNAWQFLAFNEVVNGSETMTSGVYYVAKKYMGLGMWFRLFYDSRNYKYFIDAWHTGTVQKTKIKGLYTFDEIVKIILDEKRFCWIDDKIVH